MGINDRRVLVIGLDGASWDVLRPRMENGCMPNLKRLAEQGATGDLHSIFPPETPAAWSSFMTGKNPGKHGVFDFLVYDPQAKTDKPVTAGMRTGTPVWEYLSNAGKTCLVLNVPTTYPPLPIKGAMISGFLTPAKARDYAHPKELVDEFEDEYGRYPLFYESMSFVSGNSDANAKVFLEELEQIDRTKFDVAEKLFDRYSPDFTMLHIWGTDRLQHELWNFMDEEHPNYNREKARKFGDRIEGYYAMLDDRIGRMIDKLGPDSVAFLVSDHGFGATHYFIDQNSWLLREGFIVLKKNLWTRFKKLLWNLGFTPYNATRVLAPLSKFAAWFKAASPEAMLRKSTGTLNVPGMLSFADVDWEKTKAYAPFGWSGIYVNSNGIRPNGSVAPGDYAAIRDAIVERWKELKNPRTGERVGGLVITNDKMFSGEFAKYGPDVMPLPLSENYMPICFFGFASKEPVYENNTLFGNHRMEGILLAHGQGVQPGVVQDASLLDMAPTILYLLGLPVHDDMDGRLIAASVDPAELAARPLEVLHTETGERRKPEDLTPEEQKEIREKLMGLGYL